VDGHGFIGKPVGKPVQISPFRVRTLTSTPSRAPLANTSVPRPGGPPLEKPPLPRAVREFKVRA
jgi:hypothetical protein